MDKSTLESLDYLKNTVFFNNNVNNRLLRITKLRES